SADLESGSVRYELRLGKHPHEHAQLGDFEISANVVTRVEHAGPSNRPGHGDRLAVLPLTRTASAKPGDDGRRDRIDIGGREGARAHRSPSFPSTWGFTSYCGDGGRPPCRDGSGAGTLRTQPMSTSSSSAASTSAVSSNWLRLFSPCQASRTENTLSP